MNTPKQLFSQLAMALSQSKQRFLEWRKNRLLQKQERKLQEILTRAQADSNAAVNIIKASADAQEQIVLAEVEAETRNANAAKIWVEAQWHSSLAAKTRAEAQVLIVNAKAQAKKTKAEALRIKYQAIAEKWEQRRQYLGRCYQAVKDEIKSWFKFIFYDAWKRLAEKWRAWQQKRKAQEATKAVTAPQFLIGPIASTFCIGLCTILTLAGIYQDDIRLWLIGPWLILILYRFSKVKGKLSAEVIKKILLPRFSALWVGIWVILLISL